ncbi:hypothetical protein [Povalibacter sp.]|uniref:hypothetical protein n=1 Tax=Povalibacter sp. TaxID=1962978 RepID=UPI002F3E89D1
MLASLLKLFERRPRIPSPDEMEMMSTSDILELLEGTTDRAVRQMAREEIAFRKKFMADTHVRTCCVHHSDDEMR